MEPSKPAALAAIDPDFPVLSTERSDPESEGQLAVGETHYRHRTPSFSLSPPPKEAQTPATAFTTPWSSPRPVENLSFTDIEKTMRSLHLARDEVNGNGEYFRNEDMQPNSNGVRLPSMGTNGNDLAYILALMGLSQGTHLQGSPLDRELLRPTSAGSAVSDQSVCYSCPSTPGRPSSSAYNIEVEEVSDSDYHNPRFQDAIAQTRTTVANLLRILESSSLLNDPDSHMRKLYEQAQSLRTFESPAAQVVGLVGGSGVG